MGYAKVFSDLLIHLSSNTIEFHWLQYDTSNISQFFWFLFGYVAAFDFIGNSMNTFYNINHVFEGVLNVIFEVFLVGIKVHMLFFDTDVEKTCFSFLFHFVKQKSHWLVIDSD